jgi:hypothetical protein
MSDGSDDDRVLRQRQQRVVANAERLTSDHGPDLAEAKCRKFIRCSAFTYERDFWESVYDELRKGDGYFFYNRNHRV